MTIHILPGQMSGQDRQHRINQMLAKQLATKQQHLASDPAASVWVCASAGTGKTKVLVDRMLNLLLQGTKPERILCLTFTKAAAGEMANRLQQRLSFWATASLEELRVSLVDVTGKDPQDEHIVCAKALFGKVLDVPGGLKIMTIHSFCQAVLRQFPMEASVNPHFQVMDESQARQLLDQAQKNLFSNTNAKDFIPELNCIIQYMNETTFSELIEELVRNKSHMPSAEMLEEYKNWLEDNLEINCNDDVDHLKKDITNSLLYPYLSTLIEAFSGGSVTDKDKALALQQLHNNQLPQREYIKLFFTDKGQLRKTWATKKVLEGCDLIDDLFSQESARISGVMQKVASLKSAQLSWAVTKIGASLLQFYQTLKQEQNLLDYDDLILKVAHLLRQPLMGAWVLYKIDGGLDHILVDEAQDTNQHQWVVIDSMVQEFFTQESTGVPGRTLFVVGDEKQSIYSFQGADPKTFIQMSQKFRQMAVDSGRLWRDIDLNVSFRSTVAVLQTVDTVFSNPHLHKGVTQFDHWKEHQAFRLGHSGHVEQWDIVQKDDADDAESGWTVPVERQQFSCSAAENMAQQIAVEIHTWLQNAQMLLSKGRPIKPGDILILVQRRNAFVHDLVRELKKCGIPVAESDRLDLKKHMAVQDLIAIAKFVCLPEDDLNLAVVLKGPMFNCDEEQLFELCYERTEFLWNSVQNRLPDMALNLQKLIDLDKDYSPYQFFHYLLDGANLRFKLLCNFGKECADSLEEFLNMLQMFEKNHTPSLHHFLSWFEQLEVNIKREHDPQEDVVKIMTVHGAKGLQAPIVFLPDTVHVPKTSNSIYWHDQKPLYILSDPFMPGFLQSVMNAAKLKDHEEYKRLLYVAMTRAEDKLYVCGYHSKQQDSDNCWYSLIKQGLSQISNSETAILSVNCPQLIMPMNNQDSIHLSSKVEPVPSWLTRSEITPKVQNSYASSEVTMAALRGTCIHKMLQYLPSIPLLQRRDYAFNLVPAPLDFEEIYTVVDAILSNELFRFVFHEEALVEVPVASMRNQMMGLKRIDRLVFRDNTIIVIDYKTGLSDDLQLQSYVHQLSEYVTVIQSIYPQHLVQSALLWVDENRLEFIH